MGGIAFLKEVRKDEDLKKSIVFIMTTSGADEDKVKAYILGAAGYILKTNPANAFLEATALLDIYWKVVEFSRGVTLLLHFAGLDSKSTCYSKQGGRRPFQTVSSS
jgi:CheY-like chemotaxis protein